MMPETDVHQIITRIIRPMSFSGLWRSLMITKHHKQDLKRMLVAGLRGDTNIRKVVIFGSFLTSDDPNDMDVAVFQDSSDGYIQLSMKYRKMAREVSKVIPIDILPIKPGATSAVILSEIENGEVVYER
jgi:uncharacterized protein